VDKNLRSRNCCDYSNHLGYRRLLSYNPSIIQKEHPQKKDNPLAKTNYQYEKRQKELEKKKKKNEKLQRKQVKKNVTLQEKTDQPAEK
jgi:hypothetical protein